MQQIINGLSNIGKPKDKAKLEVPSKYGGDKEGLTGFLT
jgi:hypothetical protein